MGPGSPPSQSDRRRPGVRHNAAERRRDSVWPQRGTRFVRLQARLTSSLNRYKLPRENGLRTMSPIRKSCPPPRGEPLLQDDLHSGALES